MKFFTTNNIADTDTGKWIRLLEKSPEGTVFQHPDMFTLFSKSKRFDPLVIIAGEGEDYRAVLLAVTIREYNGWGAYFSSRTVVYGGPVTDPDLQNLEAVVGEMLRLLIQKVKRKSVFIQFRNFRDMERFKPLFREYDFRFMDRLNYLVDTTSADAVKKRMNSGKWRQIKKGLKNGAEIISPGNEQQVKDFYDILYNLYRYKVKKPLPDYSFFHTFYEDSLQNKTGIIRLVTYRGKVIGGILAPVFQNRVIYEWYVCGLDHEYKQLYPSVLATWAAIDYAVKNNISTFDFMGVGVPGKDYGVRDFKARFGGELVNYGRFGRINNKLVYLITEIGFNLLALLRRI